MRSFVLVPVVVVVLACGAEGAVDVGGSGGASSTTEASSAASGGAGGSARPACGAPHAEPAGPYASGCGACGSPRGAPIGGGEDYPWIADRTTAAYVVATAGELLSALAAAQPCEVVYVDDEAAIDLTGRWNIVIPEGVTLASGRGRDGSEGALIHSDELGLSRPIQNRLLFETGGPGVRVTGLRLRGPDVDIHGSTAVYDTHEGITIAHDDCVVDNDEIWGFSRWAVGVIQATNADIHHNHIHHNRRYGLGYGVNVSGAASALVEANRFDANRHSIASNGGFGPSYEARYNLVGPTANGHAFDMHGKVVPSYDEEIPVAGEEIRIHHNTFQLTARRAVFIRGVPQIGAWIEHNSLAHGPDDGAILQDYLPATNFFVADNCFDTDAAICD